MYFTRWLIRMNSYYLSKPQWRVGLGAGVRRRSFVQMHTNCATCKIRTIWQKSYEIEWVRSYELDTKLRILRQKSELKMIIIRNVIYKFVVTFIIKKIIQWWKKHYTYITEMKSHTFFFIYMSVFILYTLSEIKVQKLSLGWYLFKSKFHFGTLKVHIST